MPTFIMSATPWELLLKRPRIVKYSRTIPEATAAGEKMRLFAPLVERVFPSL